MLFPFHVKSNFMFVKKLQVLKRATVYKSIKLTIFPHGWMEVMLISESKSRHCCNRHISDIS